MKCKNYRRWDCGIKGQREQSASQFRDDSSNYQKWLDFLQEIKLSPNSIIIEVTENLLLDMANANSDRMLAFQHAHIEISLDDFGTGYCSVAFLKRFDIEQLAALTAAGCYLSQEYPFSKPISGQKLGKQL